MKRVNCACASVSVLKPSARSEKFCDSWPELVYQLGNHQMDDVGGKSVYVPVRQTSGVFYRRYPPFSELLFYLAFLRTEQTKQTIRRQIF